MPETPDATVTISAERVGGVWTLYGVPSGAHTDGDRAVFASGPDKAGLMLPASVLEQFWQRQRDG